MMRSLLLASLALSAVVAQEAAGTSGTVMVNEDGSTVNVPVDVAEKTAFENATSAEDDSVTELPGSDFGVGQALYKAQVSDDTEPFEESEVMMVLEETAKYMEEIEADEKYADIYEHCYNFNEMCSIWASQGSCTKEDYAAYMTTHCAPACRSCDKIENLPGIEFGVVQNIHAEALEEQYRHLFDEDAVMKLLQETKEYMDSLSDEEDEEDCLNNQPDCTLWATLGECLKNPDYLLPECGPACKSCGEDYAKQDGPGKEFGVVQVLDPALVKEFDVAKEAVEERLKMSTDYYNKLTAVDEDDCYNSYAMCTIWATQKKCETDEKFMESNCPVACMSCDE